MYHSAAVTSTGEVYTCGCNEEGEVQPSEGVRYDGNIIVIAIFFRFTNFSFHQFFFNFFNIFNFNFGFYFQFCHFHFFHFNFLIVFSG